VSFATARVEYAPGFDPLNHPDGGDWETLGNCRESSGSRGRQDGLARMEPGKATFVVDDPGALIFAAVLAGTIRPLTPVRFVITRLGVDHVYWTGYMVDAPQPSGSRDARVVTVSGIDWLAWATNMPMPEAAWSALVAGHRPLLWWLDQSTGSMPMRSDFNDRVINRGTLGPAGDLYVEADPFAGFPMFLDPFFQGYGGRPWGFGWASTRTPMTFSTTYSIAFWFRSSLAYPTDQILWAISQNPPDGDLGGLRIRIALTTAGYIQALVSTNAGTTPCTTTVNHADGDLHLVIISVSPSAIAVRTDLDDVSISTGGTPLTGGYVWSNSYTNIYGSLWSHFSFHDGLVLTSDAALEDNPMSWWMDDTTSIAASQTAGERIERNCLLAGITDPPAIEDHTSPMLLSDRITTFGGNLAEAIDRVGTARLGTVWMTRTGAIRVRDHLALSGDLAGLDPVHYQTRLANLTDHDFDAVPHTKYGEAKYGEAIYGGPDLPVVRRRPRGTTAGRLDRVINEVRVTDLDGYPFGAVDAASQARYGRRVHEVDTEISTFSNTLLRGGVAKILATYAEPPIEVGEVTVWVWGRANAADLVLSAELESLVHYHETLPRSAAGIDGGGPGDGGGDLDGGDPDDGGDDVDGGAPGDGSPWPGALVKGSFRIQAESWSWAAGTHWTVTYTIDAA
jgi:hypothetical protein